MKTEWIKLEPSEFYHIVMNDIVGEKKISTKVGYNYYEAYCFIDEEMGIFLYTYFEDNVPEYLTKEELTEHFKPILRKDKLNKIMKKI